jgi:hypothetical protein
MNEESAFGVGHFCMCYVVWQEGNETVESFSVFSGKLGI